MAIISRAMLTIRLSSSYVLIITTPSAGFSERAGARPPATRVNTLFGYGCPGNQGENYKQKGSWGILPPNIVNKINTAKIK